MEKINLFFNVNNKNSKTYCERVCPKTKISDLYDIVESKSTSSLRNTHVFRFNGRSIDEDKTLEDYNICKDSTLHVCFSLSRTRLTAKPDIEGELMFTKFIGQLAHDSGVDDINIVSLMSYNVDISNTEKILLQQLQWPTVKAQLAKLEKKINQLEGIVNLNIILPDSNFTNYNKMLSPDTDFTNLKQNPHVELPNPQIDSICEIKLNSAFTKNAHEYNYRISKYSTMLKNFKLKKLFGASKSLEKIVLINFYYVGIVFTNPHVDNPKKCIASGIDFYPLKPYNLNVCVWTGEKII